MKNMKRSVALLVAIALLIGCAAGGTMAWLMDKTTAVTNTFVAGNINIDGCHFEYNKQIISIINTNTVWNVSITNSLLFEGGIELSGDPAGSIIKGVLIEGNTFSGNNKSFTVNMGTTIPDNLENIILGVNQYHGTYQIERPELKMKGVPQFFEYMPLYNGVNQIPWGRDDSKGIIGEIRHDANNLYFKTIEGWKLIPLNKQYAYDGYKNNILTYVTLNDTTVPANQTIDVIVDVEGLNSSFEYVVQITPSSWLEGGITVHAYKTNDKINIRFTNHYTQDITLKSQRWNISCQVIDY